MSPAQKTTLARKKNYFVVMAISKNIIQQFQSKESFAQEEICKRINFGHDSVVGDIRPEVELAFSLAFKQPTHLEAAPYLESIDPSWIRAFPIRALQRKSYIPASAKELDLARAILGFMGVGSIEGFNNYYAATLNTANPQTYAAWIRMGELSVKRTTGDFSLNKELLLQNLKFLCQNSILFASAKKKSLRITTREVLQSSGIEFIEMEPFLTAPLPTCACYWVGSKPVVQVSTNEMDDSKFLEAVFHAVGHILLHPKRAMCLIAPQSQQGENAPANQKHRLPTASNIKKCDEATQFAQNLLLSEARECELICGGHFEDPKCIRHFSGVFHIRPGILVERLQQQGKIPRRSPLNEFKQAV